MKLVCQSRIFAAAFCFFTLVCSTSAYAYLDPGSGSLFFQALIGVLLGALVTAKVWWRKVKSFFLNLLSNKKKLEE